MHVSGGDRRYRTREIVDRDGHQAAVWRVDAECAERISSPALNLIAHQRAGVIPAERQQAVIQARDGIVPHARACIVRIY
jgi:hypothetical protein